MKQIKSVFISDCTYRSFTEVADATVKVGSTAQLDCDVGDCVVVEAGLCQPLELFEIGIPQLLPFGRMPVCR